MEAVTETKRRFAVPPWTILILQFLWLVGVLLAFRNGFAWHNVFHAVMALVSLVLIVGLFFRWRFALWGSGIIFAAATGGTLAHKFASLGTGIGSDEADMYLLLALLVQIGGLALHQTRSSFRWFYFESLRSVRLWFWVLSVVAFCVWAVMVYHGSAQAE